MKARNNKVVAYSNDDIRKNVTWVLKLNWAYDTMSQSRSK